MNRRRIQALSRRITNRALADQLGVSTSTLYRYKSGKVKNPKTDIRSKVDSLWDDFKNTRIPKTSKQKQKLELRKLDYSLDKVKKFSTAKTKHYIYKIDVQPWGEIEGIIKDLIFSKPQYTDQAFSLNIVGLDGDNHLLRFSTPAAWHTDLEFLQEKLVVLLKKPSKTLKQTLYYEIVQIVR